MNNVARLTPPQIGGVSSYEVENNCEQEAVVFVEGGVAVVTFYMYADGTYKTVRFNRWGEPIERDR